MKKKLSTLILSVVLLITCCVFPGYAATNTGQDVEKSAGVWVLEYDSDGEAYIRNKLTNERIVEAVRCNADGELEELDIEDYVQIKNSLSIDDSALESNSMNNALLGNDIEPMSDSGWMYLYEETRNYVALGTPIKVSADLRGPGTIFHLDVRTIQHSFGGDVNVPIDQTAITIGAGFSWNVSAKTTTSNGYVYPVPSGELGYIQFTPYLNVTEGDLYHIYAAPFVYLENYLGKVWGKSPRKYGDLADGIYELVLR